MAVATFFCTLQCGLGYAQVSVLTYHNDVARTGQNLNEAVLTPANVNQNQFGKLVSYNVDGFVIAQPLYLQNIAIPNLGAHNVVYVATLHDSVYAFDADSTNPNLGPLWQVSFVNPAMGITTVSGSDAGCTNVTQFHEHGITGTPVIDPDSGTLYVIAKTQENGTYVQRLHALDITNGQEKFGGPVAISASVPGTGDGTDTVNFNPLNQMSRPGLLLLNHTIYAMFAANGCKGVHNHGWVLAYDAQTLQQVGVFNTTPNANNGGPWQAGSGAAADSEGNIYLETADATFDVNIGGADFGDSILKLTLGTGGLSLADYFTPSTQAADNLNDLDLGSAGPLVLPDQPGPYPHLLIGSGKDERIYLLNRDAMGGYNPTQDLIVQEVPPAFTKQRDGVATYWNGTVYFEQFNSPVIAYSLSNGLLSTAPIGQTRAVYLRNNPSSISANGDSDGILWLVSGSATTSTLRAFDPSNLLTEFYDSDQAGARDTLSPTAHWATPTIANAKVYVGTQTQVTVYGLTGVAPQATLSPTGVTFSSQKVGSTSSPQAITLTNTGTALLAVNSIAVNGTNGSDFGQTNNCSTNLAPGAQCTIQVTFSPTAAGVRTGTVTITDNAGDSPQVFGLTGTGVTPVVSLVPSSLGFGTQKVGTTSTVETATLTNTGTATLTISSIVSSGDFTLAATATSCPYAGGTVSVAASCTIDVTFTPSQTGSRVSSILVTDNALDSPESVSLTGTGAAETGAPLAWISQPLVPAATPPGGGDVTLTVSGANFASGAVVNWNGGTRPTNYISSSKLTVIISASDVATAGLASVTVTNMPGAGTSNIVFFEITNANANLSFGRSDLVVGTNPLSVSAGDFNADGKLDLVVANRGSNNVSVLLGNGDSTFQNAVNYGVASAPAAVVVGDFNGDGKLDLAVANAISNNVSVLLGNGDGTFQAATVYGTDTGPSSVAVGDFDGDGMLDLVTASSGSNDVSVLLGNGDGSFQAAVNYGADAAPSSVAVGDFNGDGRLDLAVASASTGDVNVLLGNGNGTFQAATNYSVGATANSVVVADLDGDGLLDLATVNGAGNNIGVMLGNTTGTFQAPVDYGAGAGPNFVALGDFDGNGKLDLAVTNSNSNNISVLLANGDGTFQASLNNSVGVAPNSVAVGDFDGDGRLDMAVVNSGAGTVSILRQSPVAALSPPSLIFANQVIQSTSTPQAVTLTNNGSAALNITKIAILGSNAGDFSQTNNCPATIAVGAQCAISVTFTPSATGTRNATFAVQDNASGGEQDASLSGTGIQASTIVTLGANVNPSAFNQTVGFTATITPQFGGQATGTVSFFDGTVLLGSTGVSNNIATLNVGTLAVGNHTITASYSGDSNFTGSTSPGWSQVINRASTTTTLVSSSNPSTVGQSVQFTATVSGQFGGAAIGAVKFMMGTVLLGHGALSNGQASINFTFKRAGTKSITARYSGDVDFLTSTSAPFQQIVNRVPTTTVVSSSQNPSSLNQQITFTATVSSTSGNPPDGEIVTFKDNGVKLGTGTLSAGAGTYATSSLKRGTHGITATYGGDIMLAASNSASLTQVVNPALTSTTLTSTPNPSTLNQSVLLTAAVTPQFGGSPTGIIKFMKGTILLGKGTISNGQASINFTFKSSGTRTITAVYGGDANFLTSTSAPLQQIVKK